jgi:lysozyme
MKISKQGLDFIKSFESFVPYVYDDKKAPVKGVYREWKGEKVKGTLTIGYGHTDAAAHPLKIARGLRITEAEAVDVLDVDLDECEEDVLNLVKQPLSQGQFDACVSLVFNMGSGNFRKSTLLKRLNKGDYKGARDAFDLYVNSGGEFMRGLQRRRDGEQVLWDHEIAPVLPKEPVPHVAEVDNPKPPLGRGLVGTVAASGAVAAVEGVKAAIPATPVIPAPPSTVTDAVGNVGLWQGMGESVASFGSFAWQQPYIVGGIVAVALLLMFGPRIAKRMGWDFA